MAAPVESYACTTSGIEAAVSNGAGSCAKTASVAITPVITTVIVFAAPGVKFDAVRLTVPWSRKGCAHTVSGHTVTRTAADVDGALTLTVQLVYVPLTVKHWFVFSSKFDRSNVAVEIVAPVAPSTSSF